jgi:hypothetical protein
VEGYLALVALFSGLLLAPLVLGSHLVLQGAGTWLAIAWFGLLCTLSLLALLAGAASLFLLVA